jgi:hypothetical protein
MMKLFERFTHETHPEVEDHLPELPEGIIVPDDLSGLEIPTQRGTAVRWMHWMPVALVLAAGGLTIALVLQSNGTDETVVEQRSSTELVQEPIDAALAQAATATDTMMTRTLGVPEAAATDTMITRTLGVPEAAATDTMITRTLGVPIAPATDTMITRGKGG